MVKITNLADKMEYLPTTDSQYRGRPLEVENKLSLTLYRSGNKSGKMFKWTISRQILWFKSEFFKSKELQIVVCHKTKIFHSKFPLTGITKLYHLGYIFNLCPLNSRPSLLDDIKTFYIKINALIINYVTLNCLIIHS